jgi:exo-beta-1,3-glucanase (GH17 family)
MSDEPALRIIDYGPYTQSGQVLGDPPGTTPPPLSQMEAQLDFIASNNIANTVRLYTIDDQQSSLIDYAISKDGLNVIPSVFLPNPNSNGSTTPASWSTIMADPAVMNELNSLVSTLESLPTSDLSRIPFVNIGNEEISQVGGWNDTDIEDAIAYVKQNLPASIASQLQFTTAETYEAQYINLQNGSGGVDNSYNPSNAQNYIATNLGNNPNINVIFVNIHPYFDGISVSNAASYVDQIYQKLESLYPNKEIVISETGWPSAGVTVNSPVFTNPQQSAVPSLANEQTFWQDFLQIANEQNISFGAFEAYNENKGTTAEDNWGLLTTNSGPTYTSSTFKTDVTTLLPAAPAGTTAVMITNQASTGNYEIYDLGNNAVLFAYPLTPIAAPWQVAGLGNFKGADTSDMMLRNSSTGSLEIVDVSDNSASVPMPLGNVGLNWQVAGFGDFSSRPGETDMLMRDSNTGNFELYDIGDNTVTSATALGNVGLNWTVAGFGDFSSRPGETDMLMRDSNTGNLELYDLANNTVTSATALGNVGLNWTVAGFGDFSSRPGETDMLMRDSNTGNFELYDLSNNAVTSATALGNVGLNWAVAGFGDVSGNPNETDMLLRDSNTGNFELYDLSNNAVTSASLLGNVGLDWQVAGIAPYQAAGAAMAASENSPLGVTGFSDGMPAIPQMQNFVAPMNDFFSGASGAQVPAPTFAANDQESALGVSLPRQA